MGPNMYDLSGIRKDISYPQGFRNNPIYQKLIKLKILLHERELWNKDEPDKSPEEILERYG